MHKKLNKIRQAVILAGGRGERLRPLTDNCPKPMILVHGRPFIEYQLDILKKNGIKEVVFLLGYLKEKFIEHFGDGRNFGLDIKYHIRKVEDDTSTRLRNAKNILTEEFLLLYGDIYWPFLELEKMAEFYHASGKMTLMVVYDNKDGRGEQGFKCNVMVDKKSKVMDYGYGPNTDNPRFTSAEVGVFILNKAALSLIPKNGNFNFNKSLLPDLTQKGELMAWKTNEVQDTITSPKHLSDFADKIAHEG